MSAGQGSLPIRDQTKEPSQPRLAYVDGLRAVAIGMVLIYHAWMYLELDSSAQRPNILLDYLMRQGREGVSLFLVISGFCLALPPLKRKMAGHPQWLVPSEFFARRCLRILPPYLLALAGFIIVSGILS